MEVLKSVYGDENVTGTLERRYYGKSKCRRSGTEHAWVIDVILKKAVKRIVIPCASITEIGDIVYKDDDSIGYETTLISRS